MDSNNGQSWRNQLLAEVESVPKIGITPGRIIVFGGMAEPILASPNEEDILIAAAQYGRGRIVTFSHDSYALKGLFNSNTNAPDPALATLHANVRRWVNPTTSDECDVVRAIDLSDERISNADLSAGNVIYWSGGGAGRVTSHAVLEYILNGGGFVHAMTPWGWLQLNPGKSLKDMPFWEVLVAVGLCYTGDMIAGDGDKFLVAENKAPGAHLARFLHDNVGAPAQIIKKAGLVKTLRSLPQAVLDREMKATIGSTWQACNDQAVCMPPSPAAPTKSCQERDLLDLWRVCVDVQGPTNLKAPGCERFPGDFDCATDSLPLRCAAIEVSAQFEDIHSTGCYAPAGQPIDVEVLSGNEGHNWRILIGAHTDHLTSDVVRRWPNVHLSKKLVQPTHRLSSPFGGLIYLQSPPGMEASQIRVSFMNIVDSPQFRLTDDDSISLANWNARRGAPGLWADIIGKHVMITLPSSSARVVENPCEVMRLWDRIVCLYHSLRGTNVEVHRHQWFVADEQPSAGYMHSGYPIVTHLDVADPYNHEFMLNAANLRENGYWGAFHELGHNMQRPEWTFDGAVEVTVNIFTLYGMEALCGRKPWIHEWLGNNVQRALSYLKNGADFNEWKREPGVALFIYAQLAREFRWDAYREVFLRYEAMSSDKKPTEDQQKIDQWFCTFSDVVNHNLSPMAQFWGIPLTDTALSRMRSYSTYFPEDEMTRDAPQRTQLILSMYPEITHINMPAMH